jgi:hypothetical protein
VRLGVGAANCARRPPVEDGCGRKAVARWGHCAKALWFLLTASGNPCRLRGFWHGECRTLKSDDLNIVENHCYSNGAACGFNSNVLTNGFHMLTEFYRDRNTLEASRLFNEKVTVFAGFETLFPDLAEAGRGSSCYNFLR